MTTETKTRLFGKGCAVIWFGGVLTRSGWQGKTSPQILGLAASFFNNCSFFILVVFRYFSGICAELHCCSKKEPCSSSITLFGKLLFVPVSYCLLPVVKCLSTETLSLSSSVDSCLSPSEFRGAIYSSRMFWSQSGWALAGISARGVHWSWSSLDGHSCLDLFLKKSGIAVLVFFFPPLKILSCRKH